MEKKVEKTGKEFEQKCGECPGLLCCNRRVARKSDVVEVVCRFEECIRPEVSEKKEEVKA